MSEGNEQNQKELIYASMRAKISNKTDEEILKELKELEEKEKILAEENKELQGKIFKVKHYCF